MLTIEYKIYKIETEYTSEFGERTYVKHVNTFSSEESAVEWLTAAATTSEVLRKLESRYRSHCRKDSKCTREELFQLVSSIDTLQRERRMCGHDMVDSYDQFQITKVYS